ncbi:AbrB/MazE/SpoVT family DNA-binding domain-containing protein [Nocardia mexicana]|uniref:AbrB/MazE/SpoVT family DNA-binding domain-containing protein n=1 Tax=Nocardia mexicana TaxID=279262 RepID=UPI000E0C1E7A|nr:AbrB/MazE/SpoVT family DNA-binding domain-containing protein [Nocardia mexicana]
MTPPSPVRAPSADVVCGLCTVGEAGRVVDRLVFANLGWAPGARLEIRAEEHAVLVVSRRDDGPIAMRDGFFRIPYRMRRRVSLFVGDRVLLAGRLSRDRLAILPPAAMQELLADALRLLER